MIEPARTNIQATKAAGADMMGAQVALRGIKVDEPRPRINSSGIVRT